MMLTKIKIYNQFLHHIHILEIFVLIFIDAPIIFLDKIIHSFSNSDDLEYKLL